MFSFNDTELAALESGIVSLGIFFRLDTSPPVRLWLGFGNIEPGVNVYDPSGATYAGFGELREIPALRQLLNGTAERVEFILSGVSGEILSIASGDDSDEVKNKSAALGFGLMTEQWAMMGSVHWCANYIADVLSINQQPSDGLNPIVRTISLSVGSRFTGRRRPSLSYLSDADQQARFPGDLFCSLVGNYAHGFNKQFPVFT